ncbi:MAG: LuxR C-terminal-related transcriptional regulator [Spirochaetaceae bacterium]
MTVRYGAFALLLFLTSGAATAADTPLAVNGVLDLGSYDLADRGIVELDGEWMVFWEALLTPEDLAGAQPSELARRSDGFFDMPGTWNGWEHEGEAVGGMGYATFVLDVLLPPADSGPGSAALWIPNASTAYRLWAGDTLVAESGTPGTDRESSMPHYVMNTARLPELAGGEAVRLILQVSNFHHRRGGMWKPIKLGTPEQIRLLDTHETVYDLLLLGSFVALALFNGFLYRLNRGRVEAGRRKTAVPLLLSVAFGALVIRVFVTGQILATQLIPGFPWALELRMEYLSAHVVFVTFAWIADRTYPGVIPRWVTWGITAFVTANALITLAFPILVYSRVVTTYNIVKSITLLAMTTRFILWAARGHREAWVMVGAILIFFLITFGETLHYREIILSRDFAPVGFIVSLFFDGGANETLVYLASTLVTLGVMLVVFNLFALRISLAFLSTERNITPIDPNTLAGDYRITRRELEILELVALGKSNKEVAAALFISEGTVKNHLYRIMRKLGVGNRTEVALRLSEFRQGAG